MPSKSSGRIEKVRKNKNATPHQKNHRWESFSTKISKFHSLQPLRKVRRHDLETEDLSSTTSYLLNGLQKWSELNISLTFSSFRRDVQPLCESLPQILHFQHQIAAKFEEYLSMHESDALEPVLDLLTAFAHDLGPRFEKHYAKSLELLISLASTAHNVEVIEWTFGALAFLFKYLSKLLVPDLRPTFDVISPLLGKQRNAPHIARFAAEAMSFLVKKAALPSHRETSLLNLIRHIQQDLATLEGDRQYLLYKDGIMTMFAEAIKSTDNTIHSVGSSIATALVAATPSTEQSLTGQNMWTTLVRGVVTSAIHHATEDTFTEFLSTLLEDMEAQIQQGQNAVPIVQVASTLAIVRKGTRISSWPRLVALLTKALETAADHVASATQEQQPLVWSEMLAKTAVVWHLAPIESLISQIHPFIRTITREPYMRWFVVFCSYFTELDAGRFSSLFGNEFQKFVAAHWSQYQNEEMLCILLPQMIDNQAFPPAPAKDAFKLPQAWQDHIVSKFERLEVAPFPEGGPYDKDPQVWRDVCLPKYAALLHILDLTSVHSATLARIAELLLRKLKLALRPSATLASDEVQFIISQCFRAYLRMSQTVKTFDTSLAPLLQASLSRFARSVGFLENYLSYAELLPGDVVWHQPEGEDPNSEQDKGLYSLVENLRSPSHDLRLASLNLLHFIQSDTQERSVLDTMIEAETTPLRHDQTRQIAMLLRRLGQAYASLPLSSAVAEALPSFIFGMLTVKLSPVWDDATETLSLISQSKEGEDAIWKIAFSWLEVPSPRWTPAATEGKGPTRRFVSDFECTASQKFMERAQSQQEVFDNALGLMLKDFDGKQCTVQTIPTVARSRALKVLNALPQSAEKRSRQIVPLFLSWAEAEDVDENSESFEDGDAIETSDWSLADRKGLLGVFSKFVNPLVLYQHERVYNALLSLLSNGDTEVQKLALKAILNWKQTGVKPYQEHLEYLLDEARFKNELTVFLQGDVIKSEHRPELMPVLLRLLFGRTISKKGAASGRHGLLATRLAVIRNLSLEDMGSFLGIAVGGLQGVRVSIPASQRSKLFATPKISERRQVGFLNMIASLILELGTNVTPYMEVLLNAVLYCLIYACRHLRPAGVEDPPRLDDGETKSVQSLLRNARTLGIRCLVSLFKNAEDFQWEPYQDVIIEEVVAPRLENLAAETTQGVSGLLQLFATWSTLPRAALFLGPHGKSAPDGILPALIGCLGMDKSKDDVKIHILDTVRNLVRLSSAPAEASEFNELIETEILNPNLPQLLDNLSGQLRKADVSNDFLEAAVETILSVSPQLQDSDHIRKVLVIATYLLKQPPKRVSPKVKGKILLVVESFIGTTKLAKGDDLLFDLYDTLSALFSYFLDRENRETLARALTAIIGEDPNLSSSAALCVELNSFVEGRINQPDYDRRLAALNTISKSQETSWVPRQWLPILHNLIFYIRNDDEFGILSSNSADGLRRFIQDCATCQDDDVKGDLKEYLSAILMPAIYAGARESSEMVRREYLRVLGFLVSTVPEWPQISDLKGLMNELQDDSTEPSFFFNILSPATARQMEALRSLESANESHEMSSQNIGQFFIPLLEHFIYGRLDGSDDHGLGAQATITIGNLATSLHWRHFRTILQRYISYIGSRPELQKQTIRLLGKMTDALTTAVAVGSTDTDMTDADTVAPPARRLSQTAPKGRDLVPDIMDFFLPPLAKHLHEKDESQVSYRVPVGVVMVKLLKLLPAEIMDQRLAAVLTDISHILRSKAAESRDMARETLMEIAASLGPTYFGFILKELRSALTKGYMLHVLSYTMHSILVVLSPQLKSGDLDYCLAPIVAVIMDDIFGVVGQEKDAEGYTNQMKEVKGSKSQDSMELISRTASVRSLIHLIRPIQAMLMQRVDLKMVRKLDTLMTRIAVGLQQNPGAETRDTLVFCYEVVQEYYQSQKPEAEQKMDPRVRKYLIQKAARKGGDRGPSSKHTYKLVRFAVDILRSILRRFDSLRTPQNLSGFLPILGDALLGGEDEVKISTFRLLAVIDKVPFENGEGVKLFQVAVKEATKSIGTATSTTTDLSQAALKMLATVLRDRRDVPVKEASVDLLLGKLKDDFTEPLYRHVTFNFLRSVLDRHIETAVVYDTMDQIGTVMVTNDDKDTRDLARGAFFQFIREYPQKKSRWAKQLNFVVANLQYEREGGRLSVMEVIHLLLMKSSEEFVREVAATCFLPLFFVLANDDSDKCQLAAAELFKEIFRRADKEKTQGFLQLLRGWLEKDEQVYMLALKIFGFYFEANEASARNVKDQDLLVAKVASILEAEDIDHVDGTLLQVSITLIRTLATVSPEKALAAEQSGLWDSVIRCIRHPQPGVKLCAIQLVGVYLSDFAKHGAPANGASETKGSFGLVLNLDRVFHLARQTLGALSRSEDETLTSEAGSVLIFLAPRMPQRAVAVDDEPIANDEDGEEIDDGEDVEGDQGIQSTTDLQWMFWRLSHILRKEIAPRAPAIICKTAAMEVLETICRRSSLERLQPSLKTILTPLHNLTDPSIRAPYSNDEVFKTKHEALKTRAQIMMDSLQKKFGTAEYSRQLLAIREEVRARRQERAAKRKIEAIAQPEKYGRDKRKKFDKDKARKRIRAKEQKMARQTYKSW